ncbi:MAG: CocE/NonD family hydrolase [Pseudomonadota bacterium]
MSYSSRPPDPALVGDDYLSMWMERLDNLPFLGSTWLRHQSRDAYWQHGSVCEDYSAIEAAVLSVGGWHDGYRNTISHLVANLSGPVKGIVGPWIHKYPHYAQPYPAIGFLQESLRWWDHWLKGIDTGVENEPDYRVWLMDSVKPARWIDTRPGRWVAERDWPSPHITEKQWHINTTADGMHSLVDQKTTCLMSVNSPQSCGLNTGEYFPFTFGPELPDNQLQDDNKSVCADSQVLMESVAIVGAPGVTVTLSADQPTGLLMVRLCDLRADGTSALITSGMLNLVHRDSFAQPQALVPGQPYQVQVILDQIAYQLPAGHRLRIALSSSYWPFLWPTPDNSTLTITAAVVDLPVRHVTAEQAVEFPPAETSAPWQVEVLREGSSTRKVEYNDANGEAITIINNDFGENLDLQHGLRSGEQVTERWVIRDDDPLSAAADICWVQTGGRDDWQWQTETVVNMRCDADYFYTTATLQVTNNDQPIFTRTYEDKIERIAV